MNNISATINKMNITKRNDGRYMGRLTVNSKRKSFYGSTKIEVKNKAKEYLLKIENGYSEPEKIFLNDYMEMWLMKYKYGKIEPSSFTRLYSVYTCQIKDGLGNKKIGEITTDDIQELIDNHANPKDENTVALTHSGLTKIIHLLKPCLNRAVKDKIISENPADDVQIPSESYIQKETKEQICLTDEQIKTFKNACLQKNKIGEYKSRDALILMVILNLGLRAGEALALEWNNIDLENNIITVTNTIQSRVMDIKTKTKYDRLKKSPKTKAGRRILKLNDEVLFYMNEIKEYDKRNNISSPYVVCTKTGKRVCYANLIRSLNRILARSENKLPKITIHTLRHTFGSTLLRKGVPIEVVSKLMGHANISITYNKYIHVLKEQESLAMKMLSIS